MNKIILSQIETDRDLYAALTILDKRWRTAFDIKDPKKRGKEILKLRSEIRYTLDEFKRARLSTNLKSNDDDNFFNKIFKSVISWLRKIEQEHRDAQKNNK